MTARPEHHGDALRTKQFQVVLGHVHIARTNVGVGVEVMRDVRDTQQLVGEVCIHLMDDVRVSHGTRGDPVRR